MVDLFIYLIYVILIHLWLGYNTLSKKGNNTKQVEIYHVEWTCLCWYDVVGSPVSCF